MPDLTVEVVGICPQWASNWEVQGSGDNQYQVQFHKDEPATCTCPAYRYSGDYGDQHCKHIETVRKHGCFYHPHDANFGLNDWERQKDEEGNYKVRCLSTAGED